MSEVFSAIASAVGLFLGFVGMFGVSEEKHPWVRNIRRARSLPGWLLIFYPEVGKWFLLLTRQDFEVSARGGSPLADLFNGMTTDAGHIWMAIAGGVWLVILMLLSAKSKTTDLPCAARTGNSGREPVSSAGGTAKARQTSAATKAAHDA